MALIFIDGMDHYAATDTGLKYNGGGANWASMQTGLLGVGQCGRMTTAGNGPVRTLASSLTTFVFGFRFRTAALPGATGSLVVFKDGSNNVVASLALTNAGALVWYRGNVATSVASSAASVIAGNAINYIEVKCTLSTTTTGVIQVRVNGADVIPSTGSVQTANTTANFVTYTWTNPATTNTDFDDHYICDTTGSQNNNFLGDTKVVTVKPNGAGRTTGWTPNGAASDWQCVDETTPDGDTTYVNTTTVGAIDAYTLSSAGTLASLYGVQVNTDARKDDSATRTIAHGVGNGTTESFDAGTNVGTSYGYLVRTLDSNPLTSAAWATGDLSTLQSAIKCIA